MRIKDKTIYAWWPTNPKPGNFGDILTPVLIKKMFGYEVLYSNTSQNKPTLIGIGSILGKATADCYVWGSGLMSSGQKVNPHAQYLAVRGPRTQAVMTGQGITPPTVIGDPALLTPLIYTPKIKPQYDYGIFAHYVDTLQVSPWYKGQSNIKIINPLNSNPLQVVDDVLKCKKIVSSSLHGVIIAHAYGIPAVWVKHSDKLKGDGIKFADHYESVGLDLPEFVEFYERKQPSEFDTFSYSCPDPAKIEELQNNLRDVIGVHFDG